MANNPDEPSDPRPLGVPATLYRAQSVKALESSNRLDELLPVTSLRIWLLVVAAAVLIAAAFAYAAVTPRNVTVNGSGRVVGTSGIVLVTSTAEGQFGSFMVEPETHVNVGQVIGYVITATGQVPQTAQVEGTLLGYLPRPGDPVKVGSWISEVSNKVDDGRTALMTVDPAEASKLHEGQPVVVSVTGGPVIQGTVGADRSDALSPARVQEGLGMLEPPGAPRVVIALQLNEQAPPGYEFTAVVLVSERTLLQQLLGMS